jgi:hypothetical protein
MIKGRVMFKIRFSCIQEAQILCDQKYFKD